jgi:hypothetical protein
MLKVTMITTNIGLGQSALIFLDRAPLHCDAPSVHAGKANPPRRPLLSLDEADDGRLLRPLVYIRS